MIIDHQVVLPRRVVPQPQPHIVTGGDCGACVLAGLFGLSVDDAYVQLNEGKRQSLVSHSMRQALWDAKRLGLADRIVVVPARWPARGEGHYDDFGQLAGASALEWWAYLRMAFDAGYYAIAPVDIDKKGPYGGGIDHWVMLCGTRELRRPLDGGCAAIDQQVLVSCSSTRTPDEEWVDCGEFLKERGGFNTLLARPKD